MQNISLKDIALMLKKRYVPAWFILKTIREYRIDMVATGKAGRFCAAILRDLEAEAERRDKDETIIKAIRKLYMENIR